MVYDLIDINQSGNWVGDGGPVLGGVSGGDKGSQSLAIGLHVM